MSSGTSTPRTASTTPTPPADVSPLTVGTQFVKKYYQVLSTAPEDIDRFYKVATSTVTRGVGSDPAVVVATDFTDGAAAQRFGGVAGEDDIRFEFEHGAIDAQFSVNSGIVLVVTGQVVYVRSEVRKSFVHTFFLGSTAAGVKRSYYVHNDILRFLEETNGMKLQETTDAASAAPKEEDLITMPVETTETTDASKDTVDPPVPLEELTSSVVEVPLVTKDLALAPVKAVPVMSTLVETNDDPVDDAPGHGVEESKEDILEDGDVATTKLTNAPTTPGSWASMVARTAPTASSPPATPLRPEKTTTPVPGVASVIPSAPPSAAAAGVAKKASDTPPSTPATVTAVPSAEHHNSHGNNNNKTHVQPPPFRPKREAECTLIIRNVDDSVTEAEIQSLFEPFSADTSATYVGCTVQGHRSIAFVDFDTPEPVVKAVQQQNESGPFMIRDLKLEVYQKVFVDKSQPHHRGGMGGRGSYRGGAGGRYSSGRDYYHPSTNRDARAAGRTFRRGGGREGRAGGRLSQSDAAGEGGP